MDEKQIRAMADVACHNTLENLRAGVWSMQSVREEIQNGGATWPHVSGMAMALAIYAAE